MIHTNIFDVMVLLLTINIYAKVSSSGMVYL
jgi:hypothetical protein